MLDSMTFSSLALRSFVVSHSEIGGSAVLLTGDSCCSAMPALRHHAPFRLLMNKRCCRLLCGSVLSSVRPVVRPERQYRSPALHQQAAKVTPGDALLTTTATMCAQRCLHRVHRDLAAGWYGACTAELSCCNSEPTPSCRNSDAQVYALQHLRDLLHVL